MNALRLLGGVLVIGGRSHGEALGLVGGFVWAVGGRFAGLACVGRAVLAVEHVRAKRAYKPNRAELIEYT